MRTGAATALAATYLARPDSETVGILGCGVQGRTNLEALTVLFPLKRVVAYDRTPEQCRALCRRDARALRAGGARWSREPREAVTGCDIVVTAGPILRTPHATIKAGLAGRGGVRVAGGLRLLLVGPAMREADKFCTDDVPQLSTTAASATSRTSRRSTPAWASWSPGESPAASQPPSAP